MTSLSKNAYIDKLDDIVKYQSKYNEKHNNKYHSTIKMRPIYVKSNTYIDSSNDINDKNPKFKIGDNVRISKSKNAFPKGYTPSWSEEVFVIKRVKNTVRWTYANTDTNGKEIVEIFCENKFEIRIGKAMKRKGNKLYIKWKSYDNLFNSWIDKYGIG